MKGVRSLVEKCKVRIGMIQMEVVGGDLKQNLEKAELLITKCCETHDPDIVVLPECMNLGWTHPSALKKCEQIPGPTTKLLTRLCKKHQVFICAGFVEKSKKKIYNSAVLISSSGNLLLKHRKLNELTIATDLYSVGDRLNVCDISLKKADQKVRNIRVGIMICADAFSVSNVIPRSLCYMGCDLILSPSSWAVSRSMEMEHEDCIYPAVQEWKGYYSPVCEEFCVTIVGVSNVGKIEEGPWKGKRAIGCSLAVDYRGQVVGRGRYGVEEVVCTHVTIVERPTSGCGWKKYIEENQKKK